MTRKKTAVEDPALTRAENVLAGEAPHGAELLEEFAALAESYRALLRKFNKTLVISDSYEVQHQEMVRKLEETTHKYRKMKEVALPICMYCKKIRSDNDYWMRLETFFSENAAILFSHGICPDCIKSAYTKMGLKRDTEPAKLPDTGKQRSSQDKKALAEDETLNEMQALVRKCAFEGNPVAPEVEQLIEKYAKQLRRFNKIVSISDSYQSQLLELNSRLELMARTDLLTGLANRWETMSRLEAEKSRSERHGKKFSIILGDIDYFKAVNDTYGHLAGDRVLRAVADTLRSSLRNEDVSARWGGEEFMLILPESDISQTRAVAAKVLKNIRKTIVQLDGHEIRVTMSMGYGTFTPGMSIDDLIKHVDDALYAAKSAGRDRIAAVCTDRP